MTAPKKIAAKKPAAKSTVVKNKIGKATVAMKVATKPAAKAAAPRKASFGTVPEPGYKESKGGVLVPENSESTSYVTTGKLQAGIEGAKDQIKGTLKNIASVFTQDFEVSEIELSVTFTADGKFLGFGTGGAMSIKVKIRPTKDSDA
eukprot:TRINITY_DN28247_c0_g1_i1.p2 TRINITY_DN28247_c0_g1~~TRINITY_DN28247_c0_g1_i1.p2  ORF type:complete len:147 (-),score=13.75 TRINITY_DN28247_c0_g1_i1:252-692(-)